MDEQLLRAVWDFTTPERARPLPSPVSAWIDLLTGRAQDTIPQAAGQSRASLGAAIIMSLLGPPGKAVGPPPADQHRQLTLLIGKILSREEPPRMNEAVVEAGIVHGCGQGRSCTGKNGTSWSHLWPQAVSWLSRWVIYPAVTEVAGWLAQQNIPGYPPRRPAAELRLDADRLAVMLLTPEVLVACDVDPAATILVASTGGASLLVPGDPCHEEAIPPGSRLVFTVHPDCQARLGPAQSIVLPAGERARLLARDEDARLYYRENGYHTIRPDQLVTLAGPVTISVWSCTCGWRRCHEQHRLAAWKPDAFSLWSFVTNAICGPSRSRQLGSLLTGMYLPLLIQEGW